MLSLIWCMTQLHIVSDLVHDTAAHYAFACNIMHSCRYSNSISAFGCKPLESRDMYFNAPRVLQYYSALFYLAAYQVRNTANTDYIIHYQIIQTSRSG